MRAGLSTIQQTLTPEAASVLSQSIGEAGRRNHSQTTPLHVAATLLASPSGYLRQACIRSHPNSSHPLQCRALELCFSVALDRLPSAQNISSSSTSFEPPISNALMAALKRAQAHQRRGCPEQQQQPLLAVKVELEQFIVSILDDPSVSRVMREASFSSPAVKATIEQLLNSSTTNSASSVSPSPGVGLGFGSNSQSLNRNLYLNPRLQQGNLNSDHFGQSRREEVSKVIDILLKSKKKNPVLVGDREPELMVKDLLQRIEKREMVETSLRNVQIIHLEKEFGSDRNQMLAKIKELGGVIDGRISSGGVILNLGDLKWLVEQSQGISPIGSSPQMLTEMGRAIVVEMSKLLARFGQGNGKLWLIGTASCETYLRCQVYHPTMENDWDLQAVSITAKAPLPGMFPRVGDNGILSGSVDFFMPLKRFSIAHPTLLTRSYENIDPAQRTKCCPLCTQGYEQELAKLVSKESEKTPEAKQEPTRQPLPQWLQMAKPSNGNAKVTDQSQTNDQEVMIKQKTEELQKKWNETCSRLHPRFHQNLSSERIAPAALSMMSPFNSNPLGRQAFQPKLQLTKNLSGPIQMTPNAASQLPLQRVLTPPSSPVRTDLALGHEKVSETTQKEQPIRDYITAEPQDRFSESNREKLASILDPDSFKSLLKGLADKVWWQKEAASAVAANVIQCRSGNNRRQGLGLKGDTWLLFAGPDRVGKKKMAMALSELICRSSPITIRLGSRGNDDDDLDVSFRGKTTLDRIAEAVQRNPSSVIVLEDIDQADMLVHGSIKRAIERGRLPDSHGREVSLKNAIFILTAKGLPENLKDETNFVAVREEKIANSVSKSWQLQLSFIEKSVKRRPDWLIQEENRVTKSRTEVASGFSFDLNEAASVEDAAGEGSRNSSDLTFEHDQEHGQTNSQSFSTPIPRELVSSVDEAIVFKPVDFGPIQSKVASTIVSKFTNIVDDGRLIEVDSKALDRIVGGVWFGGTELDDWVEKVLVPSFHRLKNALKTAENSNKNVKLISVIESERRSSIEWLPSKITLSTADVL